tara:strand:- start:477 stop:707 length:231 start_codon:yes stop_codon:yes gene_type:complete
MKDNGWEKYQEHVLSELKDLKQIVNTVHSNDLHHIDKRLLKIETTLSIAKYIIPIIGSVGVFILNIVFELLKKAVF